MKTNFLNRSILVLAIMLLSVSIGFSQNEPKKPLSPNDEPCIMSAISDLSQEQKDKITNFQDEMKKKSIPLRAQLDIKEAELDALMVSNSELKTKESKLKEINDVRFQLNFLRIEFHSNVRALLNDNQKVELDNFYLSHSNKKGGPNGQGKHQGKHQGKGHGNGNGNGNGCGNGNGNGPQNHGQNCDKKCNDK